MRLALPALLLLLFACTSAVAQTVGIKVDSVVVNTPSGVTGGWKTVTFPITFGSVPVVVVSPTNSNSDPATVRIRNVTTSGFEALVVEPQGSDGATTAMTIDYFAAEQGTYNFPGAVRLEVGTHSTTTQQGSYIGSTGWDSVSLSTSFSTPAVLTQIQTTNSQPSIDAGILATPWLEVAVDNVTGSGFDLALERSETSDGTVVAETIGYVVMESGTQASRNGQTFQALSTANNVRGWDDGCFTNTLPSAFPSSTPLAIVSANTRAGNNGGWARRCSLSTSDIGIAIDEDLNVDSERTHIGEEIGVLFITGAFSDTRKNRNLAAGQFTVAAGASSSLWTNVTFATPFDTTPYVFALNRADEAAPSSVRLRNISTTGFDIALVKPNGEASAPAQTTIDYLAAIPGQYAMSNGDLFEIGGVSTTQVQGLVGATGWETISFNSSFSAPPALLTQVQTIANEPAIDPTFPSTPWLTVAARNLTSTDVELAFETAQTSAGSVTAAETIAYFAAEDGANGTIETSGGGSIGYEMLLSADNIRGWDNGCYNTSFANTYSNPLVVASQVRRDGSDGGWVRRCALSSNSVGLTVDEDRDYDSERSHTSEQAGIFVFEGPLEGDILLVDHYAISHSGSGVTCEPERVTINAHSFYHANDDSFNATIRITATSTTPGWSSADVSWSLASGINSLGATGPGSVEYTFATGESQVELWLTNLSQADIDIDIVDIDKPGITDIDDGGTEDPILAFKDTGLRFYADADGDGNADGTTPIQSPLTAGTTSGQMILRAVQTDSQTGACTARTTGAQDVRWGYECVDPSTCIRTNDLNINGTAITNNNLGATINYQTVNVTFDSQGQAPFNLQYFDAGQIRLHSELQLAASAPEPAILLTGVSDSTVVKPANFIVTTIEAPDSTPNPSTTTSGSGFVAAGSPFNVTVEARGSSGLLTPNYGKETSPEGIKLVLDSLVLPASGGTLGSLNLANSFSETTTQGRYQNTSVNWDNVGTITFHAEVDDGDYLGGGNIVGTETGNVGRFYPAELSLLSSSITDGCATGGFSYMASPSLVGTGPIDLNYTVQALTAAGTVPSNYQASYPTAAMTLVAEDNNDGVDMSARVVAQSTNWAAGQMLLSGSDNATITRLLSGGNELVDGPFSSLQVGIKVDTSVDPTDFSSASRDLNTNTSGDCTATNSCDSVSFSGTLNAVFGRLWAEGAAGPETAPLAVEYETQWWNGSNFVINGNDSCTEVSAASVTFDSNAISTDTNRTVTVGSGTSTGSFASLSPGISFSMISGDAGLEFSAPGAGNIGRFYVDTDLSLLPELRFDWDQNGNNGDDTALPSIEVYFGSYRGHDKIIYWREVF